MPKIPSLGFDVWVEMEGERLPEFGVEEKQGEEDILVYTCWVPSEAGKTFLVNITPSAEPRSAHWRFYLNLDGSSATTSLLRRTKKSNLVKLDKESVSATMTRTFRFGQIQLTDDDSSIFASVDKLGEIEVLLKSADECIVKPARKKTKKKVVASKGTHAQTKEQTRVAAPIHEKAKKGLAHCILHGEEKPVVPGRGPRYALPGKKLRARVVFKYRNMDILIAQGIAPRKEPPPRPASSSSLTRASTAPGGNNASARNNAPPGPSNPKKRKAAAEPQVKIEVNIEEEHELMEEEKALEARLAAIRTKRGQNKKIKTEVKCETKPVFIPGEVIDLT